MTTIMHQSAAESGTKGHDAGYSRGGVALFACAACVLGFLAASALNGSGQTGVANASPAAPIKGGRAQHIENEVLQGVLSDINALKQDNAVLREEVATLTEQNGIIDKIIGHVRDLQGADRKMLVLIKTQEIAPRLSEGEGDPDPPVASFVRHEVVTPRSSQPVGQAPVPEKRPAEIHKGEVANAKGDSPG